MNTNLLLAAVLAASHSILGKESARDVRAMIDNHYQNKPKPRKWHGQSQEHRDWNAQVNAKKAAKKARKQS